MAILMKLVLHIGSLADRGDSDKSRYTLWQCLFLLYLLERTASIDLTLLGKCLNWV